MVVHFPLLQAPLQLCAALRVLDHESETPRMTPTPERRAAMEVQGRLQLRHSFRRFPRDPVVPSQVIGGTVM